MDKNKAGGGSHEPRWKFGKPVPRSFFEILQEDDPDRRETQRDAGQEHKTNDPVRREEEDQCQD